MVIELLTLGARFPLGDLFFAVEFLGFIRYGEIPDIEVAARASHVTDAERLTPDIDVGGERRIHVADVEGLLKPDCDVSVTYLEDLVQQGTDFISAIFSSASTSSCRKSSFCCLTTSKIHFADL